MDGGEPPAVRQPLAGGSHGRRWLASGESMGLREHLESG
jgi:hypothetical protein